MVVEGRRTLKYTYLWKLRSWEICYVIFPSGHVLFIMDKAYTMGIIQHLFFDDGKVIEIDDMVSDITDTNWVFRSERTVYLAFYTKRYISNTYKQIDNSPKYCKDKKNERTLKVRMLVKDKIKFD